MSVWAIVLFGALFLSMAVVSGNNLAACVGTAVGAKIIRQRTAVAIGAFGFVLGLLTLGHTMGGSVRSLLPENLGAMLASEMLLSTMAVFVLGNIMRVPFSVTSSLTGLLTGVAIAQRLHVDYAFLNYVVAVWALAPILSIAAAFFAIRPMFKASPKDIWKTMEVFKVLIIAGSFATAYAAGANALAMIVAIGGFDVTHVAIAIVAIAFGSFFLSSRDIRRLGSEMYALGYPTALVTTLISTGMITFASTNGIPLSSTQTLSAAVFGSGLSHKDRFMSMKPFLLIVAGWVIAPLLSLGIGLIL